MVKALARHRFLLLLFFLALTVKLFSLNAGWVERYYSTGVYPGIAKTLRTLFGWLPVSLGDLLYAAAFVWLVRKAWKLVLRLKNRPRSAGAPRLLFIKYLKLALVLYLAFGFCWGLNYYRQGIETQLDLKREAYSKEDLLALTLVLQKRLNDVAARIDSAARLRYNENRFLFAAGATAYRAAAREYPFLSYSGTSIKPSLFTPVGHWFGFTGYYNPFSAEAQLKTTIPVFLKPFVVTHEIAHQLGYAKENEASFVAYFTCKHAGNDVFLYSAYFEVFRDAAAECLRSFGSEVAATLRENLHPRVKQDLADLRQYLLRNQNFIEPFMSGAYDKYLKLNNQPKGHATYNEVVAYLVAYAKKFGTRAI